MKRLPCENCEARKDFEAFTTDSSEQQRERVSKIITNICGEALPHQVDSFLEQRRAMAERFEADVPNCPGQKRVTALINALTMLATGDNSLDMQIAACENPYLETADFQVRSHINRDHVISAKYVELKEM